LTPVINELLTDIARYIALPFDVALRDLRRRILLVGSFLGVASGNPPLLNACLKLFVYDLLAQIIGDAFLRHKLGPARV